MTESLQKTRLEWNDLFYDFFEKRMCDTEQQKVMRMGEGNEE